MRRCGSGGPHHRKVDEVNISLPSLIGCIGAPSPKPTLGPATGLSRHQSGRLGAIDGNNHRPDFHKSAFCVGAQHNLTAGVKPCSKAADQTRDRLLSDITHTFSRSHGQGPGERPGQSCASGDTLAASRLSIGSLGLSGPRMRSSASHDEPYIELPNIATYPIRHEVVSIVEGTTARILEPELNYRRAGAVGWSVSQDICASVAFA